MKLFGVQHSARASRRRRGLPPFGSYHADAVHFDGATNLARGAALTGVSGDYTTCLMSAWLKMDDETGVNVAQSRPGGLFTQKYANDPSIIYRANMYDAGFNGDDVSAVAAVASGVWKHILIAYDGADVSKCKALLDGADVTDAEFFNEEPATLTGEDDFLVGGREGSTFVLGDCADYYLAFDQWLDLSNPANVAKFIADGKPVDLGVDGSTPTGTAPTIFFSGDATGFATNKGTGGAFTLTGVLTNASTSPSD